MKSLLAIIAALLLASAFTSQVLAQWTVQNSGIPTSDQVVLAAVNQNVCWGVTRATGGRYVTRTTNGGTDWVASHLTSLNDFSSIAAVGADTAWISTSGVYKTTNGGVNWTQQLVAGPMQIVRFFDSNNGVCIGDGDSGRAEIYTTTNKGATWTRVQSSNIPILVNSEGFIPDNAFVRGNAIWVPTNGNFTFPGSLYKSTDRGLTWNVTRPVVDQGGSFCAFKDSLNGLLSSAASNVVKRTTDGGTTWTTTGSIPQGVSPLFMCYVPGTNGSYMVTSVNPPGALTGSAYTLNNGATWTTVDNVTHGKAAFFSPSVGWSWGGANVIHKWTGNLLVSVEQTNEVAQDFRLEQNYPNPFNPTTTIRFAIPVGTYGHTSLRVYDVLGREVMVLVNEELKAGSYETTFDATGLSSGVYYYKLETKDFVSTKKLLLLR
jgi:photosystem II stability/assembly factor-like uncharacterized protein